MARRRFTPRQFLDAARAIAAREGAGQVTIEAVARAVGATKGGVLHSFPSKAALIEALIADICAEWERNADARIAALQGQPAAVLRGYLRGLLETEALEPAYREALLVAVAEAPALLGPIRESYARYRTAIEAEARREGRSLAETRRLWMAGEGVLLLQLIGVPLFSEAERDDLFEHLLRTAERLETMP